MASGLPGRFRLEAHPNLTSGPSDEGECGTSSLLVESSARSRRAFGATTGDIVTLTPSELY